MIIAIDWGNLSSETKAEIETILENEIREDNPEMTDKEIYREMEKLEGEFRATFNTRGGD